MRDFLSIDVDGIPEQAGDELAWIDVDDIAAVVGQGSSCMVYGRSGWAVRARNDSQNVVGWMSAVANARNGGECTSVHDDHFILIPDGGDPVE